MHLDEALRIHRETMTIEGEADALGNLGIVYLQQKHLEKAEEAFQRSLSLNRSIGRPSGEANALANLGLISYRIRKDRARGCEYLKQASDIFTKIKMLPERDKIEAQMREAGCE